MADLYDRLYPADADTENIAVHYFYAALVDYATGDTPRAQIITAFALEDEAITDLDVVLGTIDALTGKTNKLVFAAELHSVMMIAESRLKYTTKASFKTRLGF